MVAFSFVYFLLLFMTSVFLLLTSPSLILLVFYKSFSYDVICLITLLMHICAGLSPVLTAWLVLWDLCQFWFPSPPFPTVLGSTLTAQCPTSAPPAPSAASCTFCFLCLQGSPPCCLCFKFILESLA